MRTLLLTSLIALALTLAGCKMTADTTPLGPAVPDTEISLTKTSVFDVHAPAQYARNDVRPGANDALQRMHDEAPPLVPHGITEMLPITREDNVCVDCHGDRGDDPTGPLMTPSHFTDLRNAPDVVREEVAGARWYCVSCHVAQTDAPALPGSARPR